MPVDFCLLDSRVSATALEQLPYHFLQIGQPVTYLEPTGETQTLRIDDATFTVVDVQPQT